LCLGWQNIISPSNYRTLIIVPDFRHLNPIRWCLKLGPLPKNDRGKLVFDA
jgi:hypothetical protein